MRFKPAFLLSAVILFAALPVWADRSPSPVFANGSFKPNGIAPSSGVQPSVNAALIDNSEAITLTPGDFNSFGTAYKFEFASPDVQAVKLNDFSTFGVSSSKSSVGDVFWTARNGGEHGVIDPARHHDRDPHSHAELVPEPPSLDLVLIGLMALGINSLRRARMA
jgi:hypothetical protein